MFCLRDHMQSEVIDWMHPYHQIAEVRPKQSQIPESGSGSDSDSHQVDT